MIRALALLLLLSAPVSGAPAKRPRVDVSAMREAMGGTVEETGAAASYAHFLQARLAHHEGDHRQALDELRLALASDVQNPYLMTGLGEQYARASDLGQAEAQLIKVLEKRPDYHAAQLLLGRVLYESGRFARARTHLGRAIRLRPTDPVAYLVLTQLWLDVRRYDEATRVVEALSSAVPGEPIGLHRLGLALAEKGELLRAEALLERAVERDPADLEAWVVLARIAEHDGRLEVSAAHWARAVQSAPENQEVLLNAGRVALRRRQLPEAQAYFGALLAQGGDAETAVKVAFAWLAARQLTQAGEVLEQARARVDEPRLHYYAGLVFERSREYARAAQAFAAAAALPEDLALDARLHRAACLSRLGRHKEALESLASVQRERPGHPGLEVTLAKAQERAGQPRAAEQTLVQALGRRPEPETFDALAVLYARQHRHDDAVALLTGALEKAPDDEPLTFSLAAALERRGAWRASVEQVRRLLARDQTHAGALNFIGYTLASHGGDLEEAERLVRRALELKPDSAAFLDSLGWVLFKKGELEAARATLERAVDGGPDDVTLFEHLGDVSAQAGDVSRAREAWRRALRVLEQSPDDADRPAQRAELEQKLKLLSPGAKGR